MIDDHITFAIGNNLYPANISEVAVLYYLIKKRGEINFSEKIELDRLEIYNNISHLLEYGDKVSNMIREKQQKYEENINDPSIKSI